MFLKCGTIISVPGGPHKNLVVSFCSFCSLGLPNQGVVESCRNSSCPCFHRLESRIDLIKMQVSIIPYSSIATKTKKSKGDYSRHSLLSLRKMVSTTVDDINLHDLTHDTSSRVRPLGYPSKASERTCRKDCRQCTCNPPRPLMKNSVNHSLWVYSCKKHKEEFLRRLQALAFLGSLVRECERHRAKKSKSA